MLLVRRAAVDLPRQLREAVRGDRHRALRQVVLGRREQLRALEHHRGGHVNEALHVELQRGADDGVVERVVDLRQRVGELVEVGDPTHDRREVDHVRAPLRGGARLLVVAQVARVHLAALAHPLRREALVGDPHLEVRIGEQAPDHRGADRAGAACD